MRNESKAVVIKRSKVSSADVLVVLYTRKFGKKKFYVNGARHLKSKLGAGTQLFVEGTFTMYLKPSLSLINDVSIESTNREIADDLAKFFIASHMAELLDKLSDEGETDERLYDLFAFALKFLNVESTDFLSSFRLVFLIKLLKHLGYAPHIDFINSSFNESEGKKICFDIENGQIFLGDSNFGSKVFELKKEQYLFIKNSLELPYKSIRTKAISAKMQASLDLALYDFMEFHTGIGSLKTKKMLSGMSL